MGWLTYRGISLSRAVLLLNLGTPSEPTAKGLRKFYSYFFADPYVFDMPAWGRWVLRNLIVKPFRAPRTAKQYAKIWLEGGSPLKVYTQRLQESLQEALRDEGITVLSGMAYSEPFIRDSMAKLEASGCREILVLPLFPQYSTATTASVFHAVEQAAQCWKSKPTLTWIPDLFSEEAFIAAWVKLAGKHLAEQGSEQPVDHVIFSYHGLPEKNIRKADNWQQCQFGSCCDAITEKNRNCYRAQCMATTRSIVAALAWPDDYYSVAFQSRFGKDPWIQPYLDSHIKALAAKGIKRLAVLTPSFVSDCLETIHEIGIEYRHLFLEQGGQELKLIPNLNDQQFWFDAVAEIARKHLTAKFN